MNMTALYERTEIEDYQNVKRQGQSKPNLHLSRGNARLIYTLEELRKDISPVRSDLLLCIGTKALLHAQVL